MEENETTAAGAEKKPLPEFAALDVLAEPRKK